MKAVVVSVFFILSLAMVPNSRANDLQSYQPSSCETSRSDHQGAEPGKLTDKQLMPILETQGEVEIDIHIKPTEHSAALKLIVESHSHCRSATVVLRGVDSEPLHTFLWRGFPPGDYSVIGTLLDAKGNEEVVVQAGMRVLQ